MWVSFPLATSGGLRSIDSNCFTSRSTARRRSSSVPSCPDPPVTAIFKPDLPRRSERSVKYVADQQKAQGRTAPAKTERSGEMELVAGRTIRRRGVERIRSFDCFGRRSLILAVDARWKRYHDKR